MRRPFISYPTICAPQPAYNIPEISSASSPQTILDNRVNDAWEHRKPPRTPPAQSQKKIKVSSTPPANQKRLGKLKGIKNLKAMPTRQSPPVKIRDKQHKANKKSKHGRSFKNPYDDFRLTREIHVYE